MLLLHTSDLQWVFLKISRVGPLHADKKYLVAAEKEGYVMSKEKENSLLFRAFKLGEIAVQVMDSVCLVEVF